MRGDLGDMREFFNKLTDNILIINNNDNIIFVNNSFRDSIGYEEKDVDLKEIENIIDIKHEEIKIVYKENVYISAVVEISNIKWCGEDAKAIKVEWKKKINEVQREELCGKILDNIKPWFMVRDLNNKVIYMNKPCLDYYNITREQVPDTMKTKLENKEFQDIITRHDEYITENKSNCTYEIERDVDGLKVYYEINKFPILNNRGQIQYIGLFLQDITLVKNIQYKILDNLNLIGGSDSKGSLTLNNVDTSIFENFRIIFNRCLQAKNFNIWIYNKDKKALIPNFPLAIHRKEDEGKSEFPIEQKDIDKYISGNYEKVLKITDEYIKKNNPYKEYYILKYPIINQGEFKGVITMSYEEYPTIEIEKRDFIKTIGSQIGFIIKYIELSRRINEELKYRQELESELQTFLEISADIVLKADKDGITEIGRGCFDILGWTQEELNNMNIEELIHPEDREKTKEFMGNQCFSNEIVKFENRIKCANGFGKWISWRSRNLIDSKGYVFASGKDITCDRIVKEQQKEIEKSKQLEEVRNEFFANISHEFKTPINMIMITSQLFEQQLNNYVLNTSLKGEMKKHINVYRQNGYRLLRLVNNLIDITKIDAGFYKIKPININIINVIEDIVLSVVEFCEGNKIHLIFDTEVEEEVIACDPDQIERVMLNLLSNAIKYTSENGEIRVNIYIEDEYVVVNVKDTGDGIPREKLELIFERFVQADSTLTRQCEGSGIGLSLVKGLVEMHGGQIEASSEIGVGSIFQFRLPRKTVDRSNLGSGSKEIKQSKIEKCSIEFADIYNL